MNRKTNCYRIDAIDTVFVEAEAADKAMALAKGTKNRTRHVEIKRVSRAKTKLPRMSPGSLFTYLFG